MKPEYIGVGNFDEENYVYAYCRCCLSLDYVGNYPDFEKLPKMGHCKDCKYFEYDSVAKEDDNVRNSYLAIKATQRQSCEEEDMAKAFQLGLAFELDEKHNEMDKTLQQQPCGDCINRQAVLDRMKERDEELSCICLKDIRGLPPITPMPKWIPVSKRYPQKEDEYKHFLTIDNKDEITIQEFLLSITEEPQPYFTGMRNVVAWMPLPEPYKAESDDEE